MDCFVEGQGEGCGSFAPALYKTIVDMEVAGGGGAVGDEDGRVHTLPKVVEQTGKCWA